ncbi:MAG: hypothetical protein ABI844_05470 [Saprospiraceae bacterium]
MKENSLHINSQVKSFDALSVGAHFISIICHPLWWPSYGLYILLALNPYLFGVSDPSGRYTLLLQVFALTFFLPVFSIFLLRRLNLIHSFQLHDRMERTGPYLITMIFYLWLYINIRHDAKVPLVYNIFVLGALITLITIFICNLFIKISAHTAVMGGIIAMTWVTFNIFSHEMFRFQWPGHSPVVLSWRSVLMAGVFLAGIIGTSRLYLKVHTVKEVYLGYILGFISQWIAFKFLF